MPCSVRSDTAPPYCAHAYGSCPLLAASLLQDAVHEVPDASTGLDVDTHGLRHSSALISGGASVKQVQTVLGHSSAAITLRVYSHLWPGDDDRTRSVMDGALGALADRVRTEDVV